MKSTNRKRRGESFATPVGRALRRAAKVARKTARLHGTPIYVWQDGKVVAQNPEPNPAVANHCKKGELEAFCSLDFHFKEVNNRFKKLGLQLSQWLKIRPHLSEHGYRRCCLADSFVH